MRLIIWPILYALWLLNLFMLDQPTVWCSLNLYSCSLGVIAELCVWWRGCECTLVMKVPGLTMYVLQLDRQLDSAPLLPCLSEMQGLGDAVRTFCNQQWASSLVFSANVHFTVSWTEVRSLSIKWPDMALDSVSSQYVWIDVIKCFLITTPEKLNENTFSHTAMTSRIFQLKYIPGTINGPTGTLCP